MTKVTIVYFEPDWCAAYVDGTLFDDGHDYDDVKIIKDIVDSGYSIDELDTRSVTPSKWKGTPDTLEELEEMYE